MGNFFSIVANIEYKSLTGNLPLWFFGLVFVVAFIGFSMNKNYKKKAVMYATASALGVFVMNYIQGQMYKARVKVYTDNEVANPRAFALRTAQKTMLSR
jgi:uncharacterized membrane protein (DUF485 family)